jgi:hypothetical protein
MLTPFCFLATPSIDLSPSVNLPYLQPELQLRVLEEPPTRVDQAEQGCEK